MKLFRARGTGTVMNASTRWLFALMCACSPRVTTIGGLPDAGPPTTVTLSGRVCAQPIDPAGFPVKVVLLIDQSAATCVIDPPGAQTSGTFCGTVTPNLPHLPTVPARLRATTRLLDALTGSNAQVALVPFETNLGAVYPSSGFVPPDDRSLRARVDQLQVEVGSLRDLEGALDAAHARIVTDIEELARRAPSELKRTRYVVLVVTAGAPRPRCASDDNLSRYADDLRPGEGKWPDTHTDECNQGRFITGFVPRSDRNQQAQLSGFVDQLKAQQRLRQVADLRVHTVLLSNPTSWVACGPACEALQPFGMPPLRWPGPTPVPPDEQVGALAQEARYVLKEIATRSDGTFTEFSNADGLAAMRFDPALFESLASPGMLRELLVEPRTAVASNGRWLLDEDGDGVANEEEASARTDPLLHDTDGDGFSDRFELDRRPQGFDPLVKDARGCDPLSGPTRGCAPSDADGDGVSNFAEAFLGTDPGSPDSDLDGFPDGLELKYGLDPTEELQATVDTDADGVSDVEELRRGSHPRQPDQALPIITSSWVRVPQPTSSPCYDFTIAGLPMVEGWSRPSAPGVGLFKVWFGEAPERTPRSSLWKAGCVAARRDVSGDSPVLTPPGLSARLDDANFSRLQTFTFPWPNPVPAPGSCINDELVPR